MNNYPWVQWIWYIFVLRFTLDYNDHCTHCWLGELVKHNFRFITFLIALGPLFVYYTCALLITGSLFTASGHYVSAFMMVGWALIVLDEFLNFNRSGWSNMVVCPPRVRHLGAPCYPIKWQPKLCFVCPRNLSNQCTGCIHAGVQIQPRSEIIHSWIDFTYVAFPKPYLITLLFYICLSSLKKIAFVGLSAQHCKRKGTSCELLVQVSSGSTEQPSLSEKFVLLGFTVFGVHTISWPQNNV